MRNLLITIAVSTLYLLSGSGIYSAVAEDDKPREIAPEDVEVSTPIYHPQFSSIDYPLGTYNYTVSWQGIPAAEASLTVDQTGLEYKISAKAKTYSGIDILYKLRYEAQGTLSAVDFTPIETDISQQENSKFKNTQIKFLENGDINAVRSQVGKDTKSMTFDPGNFTLDPFSAAFMARGLKWELGKTAEFDTFNGKTRYLIRLTAVDHVIMTVNDVERPVWVISPKIQKLTSNEPEKKLREAKIYLTDDKERSVLQIVSEVFIGSVKTKLDSFTPADRTSGASLARNQDNTVKLVF